ncbi:MAG: VPEID-CTERM sorting domain-containing protein [Gemmobacter sp.]|uniref:VPEID-CTERM sorting domain-containing protein n=1 Tax=Gemmobacter sp. TaxID=1898957 RepID=UPI00391AD1F8
MTSFKTVALAAVAFGTMTAPAMAQSLLWWLTGGGRGGSGGSTTPVAVPEIDGSTALLAVAAIVAALAFAWERNRRRA